MATRLIVTALALFAALALPASAGEFCPFLPERCALQERQAAAPIAAAFILPVEPEVAKRENPTKQSINLFGYQGEAYAKPRGAGAMVNLKFRVDLFE